jgi:hypothetical protein
MAGGNVCDQRGHLLCRPVGCPPDPSSQPVGFGLGRDANDHRLSMTVPCRYSRLLIIQSASRTLDSRTEPPAYCARE